MDKSGKNTGEGVSSRSGTAPPAEYRWKPGQSGNPAGRTAGACLKEWLNSLAGADEASLRRLVKDAKAPVAKRAAAQRILHTLLPPAANYQSLMDGTKTLEALEAEGVDTSLVKRCKERQTTLAEGRGVEVTRKLELHNLAGEEFDRIADRTDGKPAQAVRVAGEMPTAIRFLFGDERAPKEVQG